jgi:hypothetical protein
MRIRGLLLDVVDCKRQYADVEKELRGFDAKGLEAEEATRLLEATLHAQANGFVFSELDKQVSLYAWDAIDSCISRARIDVLVELIDLASRCEQRHHGDRVRSAICAMHLASYDPRLRQVDVFLRIGRKNCGQTPVPTLISLMDRLCLYV